MTKKTPYWVDYLKHPAHVHGVMVGLVVASLASIPWGGNGFGLCMLAMAAVEVVALAVVPGLPSFRAWADEKERAEERQALEQRLLAEIKTHNGSVHLKSYEHMKSRAASLRRLAKDTTSTLTAHEVSQMEDVALDYLRLCLGDAVMSGEKAAASRDIGRKLEQVRERMNAGDVTQQELAQLRRAELELVDAAARQMRMASRRSMLEASLVSMPLRMEEVYQMVMTSPRDGNLGTMLEESLSKLRVTEEVAMELDQELGLAGAELVRPRPETLKAPTSPNAVAGAASRRSTTSTRQ